MPCVTAPKMTVISPISSRLTPHVASITSSGRPYSRRMINRSMTMPRAPTTIGASSMPAHSGSCANRTAVSTVKAPAVKNSPWARFTMRIIPKISARPSASSTRIVMEFRISRATMATVSRLMPASYLGSGWRPGGNGAARGWSRSCRYFG